MATIQTIPARSGVAIPLKKGQTLKIINTHGQQVIDTFAFSSSNPSEFMSMSHTRAACSRLIPAIGQSFVSSQRAPMLMFVEDTSPGIHDSLIAACDVHRYRILGAEGYHDNCSDNLHKALKAMEDTDSSSSSIAISHTPEPLNLFMNIPVFEGDGKDAKLEFRAPVSKKGDYVKFKAEMDLIVVTSACPMDLNMVNGGNPTEAHFVVE